MGDGEIVPLQVVGGELGRETMVGGIGLGDDEKAGGILVDAVDDAGAEASADAGEGLAAVVEEGVYQRSRRGARRRMHDEPGGLVDDDDIGILVDDFKGDRFGGGVDRCGRRQLHDHVGSGGEALAGIVERRAVGGGDGALEDQRLEARAA